MTKHHLHLHKEEKEHKYHFDSLQLHAGHTPDSATKSRAVPIYATTSYVFKTLDDMCEVGDFRSESHLYSRMSNPTTDVFQKRMAALEGGVLATATSSGLAALFVTITTLCKAGDNVVASSSLYGGSFTQRNLRLPKLGITTKFVATNDPEDYRRAIDPKTKLIFAESIGNPLFQIPDFKALADVAHEAGIPLVIDNTFGAGGYLVKPIEHGADIIVHSATKWIGGHGTTIGGVVIDGGKFNWNNGKFPDFTEPCSAYYGIRFWDKFGYDSFSYRLRKETLCDVGACQNPFGSFMLIQGLETLSLRVQRQVDNALELARWLQTRDEVAWVSYPGLENHPSHEMAKKYLVGGFGGVLTFGVKGSLKVFIESVKMASHLANVGDAKTLIAAPAFTSHAGMSAEEQEANGITKEMIRVSVGIE